MGLLFSADGEHGINQQSLFSFLKLFIILFFPEICSGHRVRYDFSHLLDHILYLFSSVAKSIFISFVLLPFLCLNRNFVFLYLFCDILMGIFYCNLETWKMVL